MLRMESDGLSKLRRAAAEDVAAIVDMLQMKRLRYANYQPTFWRVAPDAVDKQRAYLREVLERPNTVAFVAESADAILTGVAIAQVVPAPAVYAPGGPNCEIDDYWVRDEETWENVGQALLAEVAKEAKETFGAVQAVVVCAQRDESKRAMLRAAGLTVASEWWTKPL